MKKVLIITAVCLLSGMSFGQKVGADKVPAAVKESFAKKYAGAKVKKWEKEGNEYEAEFNWKKMETSANFDSKGTFLASEQDIKTSELPKGVSDYCSKNFAGYKISEAAKMTDASGKITFEVEMTKGKTHFDALFDSNGKFIKKVEQSSEAEED